MFLIGFVGGRFIWWNIWNSLARIFCNTGTILLWSTTPQSRQTHWCLFCHGVHSLILKPSLLQSCGQSYILLIICIWPSGFRTAPGVALKIPKPWNAQSFFYRAKPLRMCLSVSLCVIGHHQPSTTKQVCVFMHTWCWCLWAPVCTHQSVFLFMLHPSCRQMETSGTTLGVSLLKHPPPLPIYPSCLVLPRSLSSLPFPSLLCTHHAERKA